MKLEQLKILDSCLLKSVNVDCHMRVRVCLCSSPTQKVLVNLNVQLEQQRKLVYANLGIFQDILERKLPIAICTGTIAFTGSWSSPKLLKIANVMMTVNQQTSMCFNLALHLILMLGNFNTSKWIFPMLFLFHHQIYRPLSMYLTSTLRFDYNAYMQKAPFKDDKVNFRDYFSKKFLSVVEVSMSSSYATRSIRDKRFTFESKLSTLGNVHN